MLDAQIPVYWTSPRTRHLSWGLFKIESLPKQLSGFWPGERVARVSFPSYNGHLSASGQTGGQFMERCRNSLRGPQTPVLYKQSWWRKLHWFDKDCTGKQTQATLNPKIKTWHEGYWWQNLNIWVNYTLNFYITAIYIYFLFYLLLLLLLFFMKYSKSETRTTSRWR